jgi:hypothetical protein
MVEGQPELTASLRGQNKGMLLLTLCSKVQDKVFQGRLLLSDVNRELLAHYGAAKMSSSSPEVANVANVSPREVRLWCMLNTGDFRRKIAGASKEDLTSIMGSFHLASPHS